MAYSGDLHEFEPNRISSIRLNDYLLQRSYYWVDRFPKRFSAQTKIKREFYAGSKSQFVRSSMIFFDSFLRALVDKEHSLYEWMESVEEFAKTFSFDDEER